VEVEPSARTVSPVFDPLKLWISSQYRLILLPFRSTGKLRRSGEVTALDAERLSQDPTFRLIGSEKIWDRGAALTSQLH